MFFFFNLLFIGFQLLSNAVLVAAVQQSESAICTHISAFFFLDFLPIEATPGH